MGTVRPTSTTNEQKRRQTYYVALDCREFIHFRKFSCCYKITFLCRCISLEEKKMEFARHLTAMFLYSSHGQRPSTVLKGIRELKQRQRRRQRGTAKQ